MKDSTSTQKQYYAFISYKREDKKVAKRLQHTLEYYKLPNKLRQENPMLPEYVRPIFRDMTDLEVGELSKQIHEALENSHYLIVVCSPRAAQSKWVNDEVAYFISLGKQDKIIPYIIEGLPHANNPDEECFPPALLALSKEKELLGANINEVGRNSAAIRVVSRMFNIRFDTLYQRYRREQRLKYMLSVIGALAVISLLSFFYIKESRLRHLIEETNRKLYDKNVELKNANDTIKASRNDLVIKNVLLDSINRQLSLEKDNVIKERDRVKAANWKMMENRSRFVAKQAEELLEKGDAYTAAMLALEILPNNLRKPDKPWTLEADAILRKASLCDNYFWQGTFNDTPSGRHVCDVDKNGKKIAIVQNKKIVILDAKLRDTIMILPHEYPVKSLAFCNSGNFLVSATLYANVYLWDIVNKKMVASFSLVDDNFNVNGSKYKDWFSSCMSFNDDDSYIVGTFGGLNGCGILYGINLLKNTVNILGESFSDCIFFSNSCANKFFYYAKGGIKSQTITTNDEGQNLYEDTGLKGSELFAISPQDNHLIAQVKDENIYLIDIRSKDTLQSFIGHSAYIVSIAFSNDGKHIASSSRDNTIKVWDVNSSLCIKEFQGKSIYYNWLSFCNNDECIIAQSENFNTINKFKINNNDAVLCNVETISPQSYWIEGNDKIIYIDTSYVLSSIAIKGDAISMNKFIDINSSEESVFSYNEKGNEIFSFKFKREGMFKFTATELQIKDALTGEVKNSMPINYNPLAAHFSLEKTMFGYMIYISTKDSCFVYDCKTLEQYASFPVRGGNESIIGYYGLCLFTGEGGWWDKDTKDDLLSTIHVYRYYGGEITSWLAHRGGLLKIKAYDSSKLLLSYISREVKIWSYDNFQNDNERVPIFSVKTDGHDIRCASISPDGSRLCAVSNTFNKIYFWEIASGIKILEIDCGFDTPSRVDFLSNDYLILGTNGNPSKLKIYKVPPIQDVIDEMREKYKKCYLTPEERRQYYLD